MSPAVQGSLQGMRRAKPGSQVLAQRDPEGGRSAEQHISTVLFPSSFLKETATDSAVTGSLAGGK